MQDARTLPRVVVAGLSGGAGKTVVSLALLLAARASGRQVRAFKKGPDYIDAAWLAWASGSPARNLDTYLMGFPTAIDSFIRNGISDGLNVIEGNRGVFDGMDVAGTHSSAVLAKALAAPVLLVLNVAKITRTAAAFVLGAQQLDRELNIAGIILNHVNGLRHERIVRESIASVCDIPVVGVVPKFDGESLIPERHLGLVTPADHRQQERLERTLLENVAAGFDCDTIFRIANAAGPLRLEAEPEPRLPDARGLKIGYFKDAAFSFYYPENLEQLERAGAELVPISPLMATELPSDISALYIGGGFPELHAAALSANTPMLGSLHAAAHSGLPIYAECGGLMMLSRAIVWCDRSYPMAEVFPFETHVHANAQGHGYAEMKVDRNNLYFPAGLSLRGHEFHYSKIETIDGNFETACQMRRGTGIANARDGAIFNNVWASYTHLHGLATPEWACGMIDAARNFAAKQRDECLLGSSR